MSDAEPPGPRIGRPPRAPTAWAQFVPAVWLFALLLGASLVATVWTRLIEGPHPGIDAIVTAAQAAIVVAFCAAQRATIVPALRVAHVTLRGWGLAGVAFAAMAVVVEAWFSLATALFDEVDYLTPFREQGWPLWSAFALISLCPAVFEELAFRGFLLQRLTPLLGARDALVLQATLFSILHLSLAVLPSHFAMGLLFGLVAQRTRSLVPGMLMHALWNALVVVQELAAHGWP